MNVALRVAYATAGTLAEWAAATARGGDGKMAASLVGRRGVLERFAAWGNAHRDLARPLVWLHAPSVGEGLQARPVIDLLRRHRPDAQVVYTHFSSSAAAFASRVGADYADYLPFDTRRGARAVMDALRPTVLVFSKLDVWPVLVDEAVRRNVPVAMIAATLAEGSARRGAVARALLTDAYASLRAVGAVDEADAERLVSLGVARERVQVTGDTRYDQVWARAQATDRTSPLIAPLVSTRPTLVAGSTWPSDEQVIEDAWRHVRTKVPTARLIIAPHETTDAHLAAIEAWAACAVLRAARLGSPNAGAADVIVVDRVGVLGDLYALADVAYVGGGFHSAGLHSVIEPAAFGAPVLFGPRCTDSRDAGLLIAARGGRAAANAQELGESLTGWMASAAARTEAGERAREMVQRGTGAAERSYELVQALL
ncbi:MAG: glycosyltransferase N-terminal domain-containing protein [Gemmatimonadaceae bacterium]|nr:glycosyltransferase N-terminal domain-containing protein [Gemmatimonadaceae bacterium]